MRGWGTVPPKIMNAAGFYLPLLALFILTSILNANLLAQAVPVSSRGQAPEYISNMLKPVANDP